MGKRIFVKRPDGGFQALEGDGYGTEEELQVLLASVPDLLSGDQEARGRSWLLIQREAGIPDVQGGANRWSVDHLFVDQDAVPTLVEVKRSSDTRIRREVVGQMLDYAANGVAHWSPGQARAAFESRCQGEGLDAAAAVQSILGSDSELEADSFWARVDDNLRAGRLRLVFVADEIPRELRRVVEFLNEQMDRCEVLAIELQRYVGDGFQAVVPRTVGNTTQAERRKGGRTTPPPNPLFGAIARRWNEASRGFRANEDTRASEWFRLPIGIGDVHYEWLVRDKGRLMLAALHFESKEQSLNKHRAETVRPLVQRAAETVRTGWRVGDFGKVWAAGELEIPVREGEPEAETVERAVAAMGALVDHTIEAVKGF